MPQEHPPEDFDWVNAQAKCTTVSMFERLRTRVREDVQKRNGVFNRQDGWKFEFFEEGDEFEVSRVEASGATGTRVAAVVRFAREGRRIHVQGDDIDVEFVAIVTLDVGGDCRFVVGEALYTDWEIRKMALEMLFFEEYEEPE
jgi:hypothetical protein